MLPVFASGIYKRCYGHHKRDKSYKKICLNFRAQKRRVECSFGIICPCPPCKRNIFFGTSNNRKNEYVPKFIIFYGLARVSKYFFKSKTTVDTNIVTKIMKKYSSSGKPPIKTPMLVSCGKRQISARTAQISHGILKMSAHITQYKNVFLYCERYFQLTAHKTMIGNQTNIMSQ